MREEELKAKSGSSCRALALGIAATEFDSAWQAMQAARMPGVLPQEIAFFVRVAADELRHSGYFRRGADVSSVPYEAAITALATSSTTVPQFLADLAAGEWSARHAFTFYARSKRELAERIPEFQSIESDEAFHSFGALLHLRRRSRSRSHAVRFLWRARTRIIARAVASTATRLIEVVTGLLATAVVLAASVVMWPLALRRLERCRQPQDATLTPSQDSGR